MRMRPTFTFEFLCFLILGLAPIMATPGFAQTGTETPAPATNGQQAADAKEADDNGAFRLGRIEVTVTASGASPGVTTIDADQMRARDAKTVQDALAVVPGVTLHRVGGRNEAMVYVRGFDLRQVPLFVDGVPVYVPYDGYVDLDRFVTDDLAEVRVTTGMTSVLIGPNALGGAINLITKRPSERFSGLFNAGLGSGGETALDANSGVMRERWYIQGSASWFAADEFPLSDKFVATRLENGGARDNSSHGDGKGSFKFALTPSGGAEYVVSYVGQRGRKDVPSYAGINPVVRSRFWRWPDWDKDALYVISNTPLTDSQYVRARVYHDRFYNELQSFDDARYSTMTRPSSFRSIYDDYSAGGSAEYGATLSGGNVLRAAGHFKEDIHREHNIGEPVRHFDNRTISVGVEDVFSVTSSMTIVAGIGVHRQMTRRAENFVAGGVSSFPLGDTGGVNPQVGAFFATPGGGQLRATASRKTRLPAIKDRYSYRFGSAVPNPDLKAEQATTIEGGFSGPVGRYSSASVTMFYADVDDLVQAFFLQPNIFQLQNVGQVRNAGFEAEWRLRPVAQIQGSVGYSYLHRESVGRTAVPLFNTPSHKAFAFVTYTGVPRVRLVGSVEHESSRITQDDAGALTTLGGLTNVAAKAALTVGGGLDLELSGANLFDRNYELYPGFPEAGRTGIVQVRYRF